MTDFVLARDGQICNVCIDPAAPDTAAAAAGELCRCLAAMTGAAPVLRRGQAVSGEICLGGRSEGCAAEELRIAAADGILWLDGGPRGLLYAVFALLEKLGCRFFAEDCQLLPAVTELTLPGDTQIQEAPVFEYRAAYWHGITPELALRLRLNAVPQCGGKEIAAARGGSLHYCGFVHTLGALAEMPKDADGGWTDRQPCLTDEKTFETVVKNLRAALDADPGAAIASVSQNDSHAEGRGCQCAACQALDAAEGTPMGSLLPFVNRVADTLAGEYPQVAFDTLAYRYTRKAPAALQAHDNVIVRLCSIECCFSHPITDCDRTGEAVEDGSFADTLRRWANHCRRIYIWDYTTNFRNYNASFPNFNVLRQNLRFFAENHVRGVFEQGNAQSTNGEFGQLRAYLLARLLWDPYMSEETYQRHIDEFLAGYYGPGAPALRRFLDRLQAAAAGVHFGIYYEDPAVLFVDPAPKAGKQQAAPDAAAAGAADPDAAAQTESAVNGVGRTVDIAAAQRFLAAGRQDFAAARAAADSTQRRRIAKAEIQLDVYEWYLRRAQRDALPADDPARPAAEAALLAAGETLYANVLAHGITHMHEGNAPHFADSRPVDFTVSPALWG